MTQTVPSRAPRLRRVLGLPVTRGHGRFITGNLIGSLGNGSVMPMLGSHGERPTTTSRTRP